MKPLCLSILCLSIALQGPDGGLETTNCLPTLLTALALFFTAAALWCVWRMGKWLWEEEMGQEDSE